MRGLLAHNKRTKATELYIAAALRIVANKDLFNNPGEKNKVCSFLADFRVYCGTWWDSALLSATGVWLFRHDKREHAGHLFSNAVVLLGYKKDWDSADFIAYNICQHFLGFLRVPRGVSMKGIHL